MSKKNGWILPAALGALALILILIFCIPVRQPKFFEGAQQIHLNVSEMFITDSKPDSFRASAKLEASDPAIEELAAIFRDYRLYRSLKYFDTLDGATTYHGDNGRRTFLLGVLAEDEVYHSISVHGKYLNYNNHLWRIGKKHSEWDDLAQRLKNFILEHSEDQNTN